MTRYRACAAWFDPPCFDDPRSVFGRGDHTEHSCEVFERPKWRDTGLLNASGEPIYASDKGPLGFHERKD